jgi:DNA-binding response OmpR family regulator
MSLSEHDLNVLVVEDDQGIADLIAWVLQDAGFTVHTETGIAGAQRAYLECHPRVVITDLVLPDGLGSDFINELKQQPDQDEVASVLISAHPQALAHAKASRADAYLPKPFDLDDLNRVVGDLVGADHLPQS